MTRTYTDDEILELAARTYGGGKCRPTVGIFEGVGCACLIGAACRAAKIPLASWRSIGDGLGRSVPWVRGCVHGFDGIPPAETRNLPDADQPDYAAGYEVGKKARARFLEQTETSQPGV